MSLYWISYEEKIPYTKTENPTKSQAKELIAKAKTINKQRNKKIDGLIQKVPKNTILAVVQK